MPTGRIRTESPTLRVRSDSPTARISRTSVLELGQNNTVQAGSPIGLLLALTYAEESTSSTTTTYKGDPSISVRIRNTD